MNVINGIKADKVNQSAFFNEETHTYYNKENMQTYISCTTLISKYKEDFDENFWSSYKALEALLDEDTWFVLKPKLLMKKKIPTNLFDTIVLDTSLFESKKQEILDEYAVKRKTATDRGTKIHSELENEFYNKSQFNFKRYGFDELGGDFVCKKDYYELDLDRGVYPEYFISVTSRDGLLRVAGMIDLLVIDGNDAYICDHKTNAEIHMTSYYDKFKKKHKTMKFPLSNLQDCSYIHYSLQMSLYGYLLQQIRPELNIKSLMIHHIDHDGNEKLIKCEYLKDDVERMLKHFKKQQKIKSELDKINPVELCSI